VAATPPLPRRAAPAGSAALLLALLLPLVVYDELVDKDAAMLDSIEVTSSSTRTMSILRQIGRGAAAQHEEHEVAACMCVCA
jgi:hypothetical protein